MTNPDGSVPSSSLGRVWTGGIDLEGLNSALTLNPRAGSKLIEADERFWATPRRSSTSTDQEVLQISLQSPRLINYIAFSAAIFPHDIYAEYWDHDADKWRPCLDATVPRATPAVYSILESRPGVLPPASAIYGHYHPQHSFSGHWRNIEFRIRSVTTILVRLVLQRNTRGRVPTDAFGQPVDYSLAIRALTVGFRVEKRGDIPRTSPRLDSFSEYETFATMTDVLGSSVDFSLRINRASHVLSYQTSNPTDENLAWRCEPQPIPWAVVNFFADTRAADGSPQVIDRFHIDPLYEGPNLNLYWANDEPSGKFIANDDPLEFGVATVHDEVGIPGNVLHAGDANKDKYAYVDINNAGFNFAPSQNWWIGGKLNFKFQHGTQNYLTPVLDFGEFNISLTPLTFRVLTVHGDALNVWVDDFDPGTPCTFFVAHDDGVLHLRLRVGEVYYQANMALTVDFTSVQPPTLRFGGYLGSQPGIGNSDIDSLILKIDESFDEDTATAFLEDVTPYLRGDVDDDRTENALLRYDTSFVTSNYRTGFVGGTINRFNELVWHPIARDFVLRRGFLHIPPTRAKYWKFEFCGLSPEPFEVYKPISKTVQSYPVSMWNRGKGAPTLWDSINVVQPGVMPSINMALSINFQDATSSIGTGGTGTSKTNTMARVLWDHDARHSVGSVYWAWNFLPLHQAPRTPCFEKIGVHSYETTVVDHTTKLGYFVGIKSLKAYRLDYAATDDSPQVIEMFHDLANISSNSNWILTGQYSLSSGQSHYAKAESRVIASKRIVRAVQFAAQQSAARQLLPDDDFIDLDHTNWVAVGDAHLAPAITESSLLGTILRVDRSLTFQTWETIETGFDDWDAVDVSTFAALQQGSTTPTNYGGISSVAVDSPPGGRIYAAARVIASNDLVAPLKVQIVDDETGGVLAESEVEVKANRVTEWYTGFTIGEATLRPWLWLDFFAFRTGALFLDHFVRANSTSLGNLESGQRWLTGPAGSITIVNNEAKVTVLGQENYIDPQTPYGTLEVITSAAAAVTSVVKIVDFDPLFLADDGNVYAHGYVVSAWFDALGVGRVVENNDKLRFEIMPTNAVPLANQDPTADPALKPYSIVIYLNDVWVKTLSHSRGARSIKGIKGRVGQEFTQFTWNPKTYGAIPPPQIIRLPRDGSGGFITDDTGVQKWRDNENNIWVFEGTWDLATASEVPGEDQIGLPSTATSSGAVMATDTGSWYGHLHVYVRNVASTAITGVKHGNVICLDYDNGIFINSAGNIVSRAGVDYGNLIPSGIPNNSVISIQFVRTERLLPANRGGYDPALAPDMIIASVNEVIVGRYVGLWLDRWRGTKRGVAGDVWSGTRPAAANYTLDTSFRAMGWAPDIFYTPIDPANPTWNEISNGGLATWNDLIRHRVQTRPRLRAQVVQSGMSIDAWSIDTLSLYSDPIIWSFSNDGGFTWYPALDIRNNPYGVLAFPPTVAVTDPAQQPGQSLMWKVESFAPGATVSSLVIRPWYGGALSGITHHVGVSAGGPNVMPYDHYPPIEQDSRFQTWSKPIPQDWWHKYRILSRTREGLDYGVKNLATYPSDTLFPADNLYPGTI